MKIQVIMVLKKNYWNFHVVMKRIIKKVKKKVIKF